MVFNILYEIGTYYVFSIDYILKHRFKTKISISGFLFLFNASRKIVKQNLNYTEVLIEFLWLISNNCLSLKPNKIFTNAKWKMWYNV